MLAHASMDCRPLHSAEAVAVLCFPHPSPGCLESRISVLEEAGVQGILLGGPTVLASPAGPLRVIGKGHSSVVVAACSRHGVVVAKSRRPDSKRQSLEGEARLLEEAARAGASPRVHAWGRDAIVMDLVPGPMLGQALETGGCRLLPRLVRESLEAARALDAAMILHREISRPHKHVIFTGDPRTGKALVIDLESATPGKCGSLTRIASFWARRLGASGEEVRRYLREYKRGCPRRVYKMIRDMLVGIATGLCP